MEEQQQEGRPWLYGVTTLMIALGIATGYIGQQRRLESQRPEPATLSSDAISERQGVPARLWQDPFSAVSTEIHRQDTSSSSEQKGESLSSGAKKKRRPRCLSDIATIKDELESRKKLNESAKTPGIEILGVIVPSSMFEEDIEVRLRARNAVISAMTTLRYRPSDEEHIGAIQFDWENSGWNGPKAETARMSAHRNSVIPFEWFVARENEAQASGLAKGEANREFGRACLVLWLPEEQLADKPVTRLRSLQIALTGDGAEQGKFDAKMTLFGPHGSDLLRTMYTGGENGQSLKGARMFSWSATGADPLLFENLTFSNRSRGKFADWCKGNLGLAFTNIVATDDQLATTMLAELKLRGVDLTQSRNHVALIFEEDTLYGRNLPITWAAAIASFGHPPEKAAFCLNVRNIRKEGLPTTGDIAFPIAENLHPWTYLRGLDGKLPGWRNADDRSEVSAEASKNHESVEVNKREMDSAEGDNQLDYIPRLSGEIDALMSRLKRVDEKNELKAIGVVGSDFYDKLLILQALRDRFPYATFFTTDLDGRFLQPEYNKWTRNVLVASSFGFSLRPSLQRTIPPFRDSYQTSLYLAMLAAFQFPGTDKERLTPSPRIFEIGRYSAVDLSAAEACGLNGDGAVISVHPDSRRSYPKVETVAIAALGCFFLFSLVIRFTPSWRLAFTRGGHVELRRRALFVADDDVRGTPVMALERFEALREKPTCDLVWLKLLGEMADGAPRSMIAGKANAALFSVSARATPATAKIGARSPNRSSKRRFRGLLWDVFRLQFVVRCVEKFEARHKSLDEAEARRFEMEKVFGALLASCRTRCRNLKLYFSVATKLAAAASLSGVGLFCAITWNHVDKSGELFMLTEGISNWPTNVIRFIAICLTIMYIVTAGMKLRVNASEVAARFAIEEDRRPVFKICRTRKCLRPKPWYSVLWLNVWALLSPRTKAKKVNWMETRERDGSVSAARIWRKYLLRGRIGSRWRRIFKWVLFALGLFTCLWTLEPHPYLRPVRGELNDFLDQWFGRIELILYLVLTFFVADAIRLCCVFIQRLGDGPTKWPPVTLARFAEDLGGAKAGVREEDLDDWIDIQIIAARTAEVMKLIYCPFVILALMIVGMSKYFTAWAWPTSLVVTFLLCAAFAFLSAYLLQTAVDSAKEVAVENMKVKLDGIGSDPLREKSVKRLLEEIQSNTRGAFGGFFRNPALKAALLPFSGAGAINLVDFLMRR